MKHLKNKFAKVKNILMKIGEVEDQHDIAGYFVEVLDYVGEFSTPPFHLNNKHYIVIAYADSNKAQESDENTFNEALAENIINLATNYKEFCNLNFKSTEERIALFRKLNSKNPKIVFGDVCDRD